MDMRGPMLRPRGATSAFAPPTPAAGTSTMASAPPATAATATAAGGEQVCRREEFATVEDRPIVKERVERVLEHRPVERVFVTETRFKGCLLRRRRREGWRWERGVGCGMLGKARTGAARTACVVLGLEPPLPVHPPLHNTQASARSPAARPRRRSAPSRSASSTRRRRGRRARRPRRPASCAAAAWRAARRSWREGRWFVCALVLLRWPLTELLIEELLRGAVCSQACNSASWFRALGGAARERAENATRAMRPAPPRRALKAMRAPRGAAPAARPLPLRMRERRHCVDDNETNARLIIPLAVWLAFVA